MTMRITDELMEEMAEAHFACGCDMCELADEVDDSEWLSSIGWGTDEDYGYYGE